LSFNENPAIVSANPKEINPPAINCILPELGYSIINTIDIAIMTRLVMYTEFFILLVFDFFI